MKTVVVTGGTGVVGSALLPHLETFETICLAHSRRPEAARVESVHGDVTATRLGLDRQAYSELARRTDAIVHCAAVTEFTADEHVVRRLNIAGTDNVLEFAALAEAPLYYVSTAFVARSARAGAGPARYLASKRIAEQHVRASGLPAAIIRPSVVIGDSATGRISRFQGLHALAGAVLRQALPIVPLAADVRIDFLPQDIVAAAIAGLIRDDVVDGEWWLTAGDQAPSIARVLDCCEAVGRALGQPPARPRLMDSDVVHRLIRPVFIDPLGTEARDRFDSLLDMTTLFDVEEPFPSSLPALGLSLSSDGLAAAFMRSMEFWAQRKRLTPKLRLAA